MWECGLCCRLRSVCIQAVLPPQRDFQISHGLAAMFVTACLVPRAASGVKLSALSQVARVALYSPHRERRIITWVAAA
jgi:hypothetical protein